MTLEVHVVTPEREVWSGEATLLIARGIDGEVGILTGHAPLLIQLAVGPLRIEQVEGGWFTVVADGGFLHVTSGEEGTRVDVMASGAEMASEIDVEAARLEAGDLLLAEREGQLSWGRVHSLRDVVAGSAGGRQPSDVTLFKSVGLAIEDVATGATVLELARARGAGQQLPD